MPKVKSNLKPGTHWQDVHFHSHVMMDALAKHLLGCAPFGMTDIGEVMEIYCQLTDSSEESWIDKWSGLAKRLQEQAGEKEQKGYLISAAELYLRASTYWRTSLICFNQPKDERIEKYAGIAAKCYEDYLRISGYPGVAIDIPYEDATLPGHFYQSPTAKDKAPVVILVPGRDTWAEDTRWLYDGLLKRGIHCLCFDGPGQGVPLRVNHMPFRPDFENVMTPVINYALGQFDCIDENRIGAIGFSFGAFLLPRACAYEKRIKVCITDTGNIAWGTHFAGIFDKVMKLPAMVRPKMVYSLMDDYAWKHGVQRDEIIEELKKYDNTGIMNLITCKTLVLDGTAEINKGSAKIFFDTLTNCEKEYKCFDTESTAQHHAQMGGYQVGSEFIGDWIADNL